MGQLQKLMNDIYWQEKMIVLLVMILNRNREILSYFNTKLKYFHRHTWFMNSKNVKYTDVASFLLWVSSYILNTFFYYSSLRFYYIFEKKTWSIENIQTMDTTLVSFFIELFMYSLLSTSNSNVWWKKN